MAFISARSGTLPPYGTVGIGFNRTRIAEATLVVVPDRSRKPRDLNQMPAGIVDEATSEDDDQELDNQRTGELTDEEAPNRV